MKLTEAQMKLLLRAVHDRGDGVPFIGYSGRLAAARILHKKGLAELMVIGGGRMPRIFITQAGREAIAARQR